MGGDTGKSGGELAGIVWEEMGWMGAQGAEVRRGQAAGPAAKPPTRAEPACFDAVETACGRWGGRVLAFGRGQRRGRAWEGAGGGMVQGAGGAHGAGRRPGGGAADAGEARGFRRSRNGLRPVGGAKPCPAWEKG